MPQGYTNRRLLREGRRHSILNAIASLLILGVASVTGLAGFAAREAAAARPGDGSCESLLIPDPATWPGPRVQDPANAVRPSRVALLERAKKIGQAWLVTDGVSEEVLDRAIQWAETSERLSQNCGDSLGLKARRNLVMVAAARRAGGLEAAVSELARITGKSIPEAKVRCRAVNDRCGIPVCVE